VKDHGLIHPELATHVTRAGHGDLIGFGDAGLPLPTKVPRVDLAFAPGRPGLLEVLDAVLTEFRVEAYVVAEESFEQATWLLEALTTRLAHAERIVVSHEELKHRTHDARAMVRTGEVRPYANVLLRSGVDFSS
jgi:D-ribose pyranase